MAALVREVTEARVARLRHRLAAALVLLLAVDTATTLVLARTLGVRHEVNPVVRWLLTEGPAFVVLANALAGIAVVLLFDAVLVRLAWTPAPRDRYLAAAIELWVGALLVVGVAVVANNLVVLVRWSL